VCKLHEFETEALEHRNGVWPCAVANVGLYRLRVDELGAVFGARKDDEQIAFSILGVFEVANDFRRYGDGVVLRQVAHVLSVDAVANAERS
jgi:hypothetical protein